MLESPEQSDLSENTLAVNFVLEDTVHLLDGNLLLSRLVDGAGYLTVRPRTQELNQLVVCAHLPILELIYL